MATSAVVATLTVSPMVPTHPLGTVAVFGRHLLGRLAKVAFLIIRAMN